MAHPGFRRLPPPPAASRGAMDTPLVARDDLMALSFVHGLDRAILYPLLRGEPPLVQRSSRLPFDDASRLGAAVAAGSAVPAPSNVEALVDGSHCASADDPSAPVVLALDTVIEQAGRPGDAKAVAAAARRMADSAERQVRASGTALIAWGDPAYPPLLSHIFDPPLVLWVRGSVEVFARTIVAIVGSRAASPYGEQTAARLGSELAAAGRTLSIRPLLPGVAVPVGAGEVAAVVAGVLAQPAAKATRSTACAARTALRKPFIDVLPQVGGAPVAPITRSCLE
jgi:hypothetical protein